MTPHQSLREHFAEVFASRGEAEAAEERRRSRREGATRIKDTADRSVATVAGIVRAVTVRPRGNVPVYEVELYDGTAPLSVLWLGRREKLDVKPGSRMVATGLVRVVTGGQKIMVDPRYELIARNA